MRSFLSYFILLLSTALSLQAQAPPGYYNPAAGLTGQPLLIALNGIINDHTSVTYNSLYTYFQLTDKKTDNTVWDMYSDNPAGTPPYVYYYNSGDECGTYTAEGDCFNREHSWPKSWFGGEIMPMYSDLFHLYPTDGWVNNKRGNYSYGTVSSAQWTSQNGSKVGNCSWPGFSGVVFEPIDAYKGDFARTYFYMSTRYYGEDSGWTGSDMTAGSQLKPWAKAMLLEWSSQDTVSQKEINRNNAVYLIQGNRNPFIDNPHYAIDIWGPGAGSQDYRDKNISLSVFPNPAQDHCKVSLPAEFLKTEGSIFVYSITGIPVFTREQITGNTTDIDLKDFSSGVYILRLIKDGKTLPYTGKILVQ